jgi:exopolyphosphatase/guanosine-5'-triphosphate,3'-diphosphate pyrophosphatase
MKLAIIDCGTNTFNLLITCPQNGTPGEKNHSDRVPVRLGEHGINTGHIAESAFIRGIEAMKKFAQVIESFHVDHVLALATSAIRDADNGLNFVEEVKQKTGIQITVIDGNREAELIYIGNRAALPLGEHISLIMDIGGGSNEFILCNASQILWKQSFRIGAARLLEFFPHSSPIANNERQQILNYLDDALQPLFSAAQQFLPTELIGSSGAFESIIEMICGELGGEEFSGDKTEYAVTFSDYTNISHRVLNATLDQRQQLKGLVPMRVDMMVISCLMIDHILSRLNIQKMRVSTYSLKEGALIDLLEKIN